MLLSGVFCLVSLLLHCPALHMPFKGTDTRLGRLSHRRSSTTLTQEAESHSVPCCRLMGFGHRVYKTFDPRAKIMKETCHKLLEHLNIQ